MEWKPIKDTDGLYLISDEGQVFSVRSNRLIKISLSNMGYHRVELNINGRAKKYGVHRLVAEAFIPNPNNYPCVNHKDEDPTNNHVDNLEWCTHKYNSNYGTIKEKKWLNHHPSRGASNPQSKTVYQFDKKGNYIAKYGSAGEASRVTGLAANTIARCAAGNLKQFKGFVFQYEETFRGFNKRKQCGFRKGAILQYDLEGNLVHRYEKAQELEDAGFRQISVNRVCRGERKSYKGFSFKHENK